MIYQYSSQKIPQHQRAAINKKILAAIDQQGELSKEEIFNSYTGIGGLHNLKQVDFDSYHAYSNAKKEVEKGQFFTPPTICKQMVELIAPTPDDTVIDLCCGMGNFFNYLPNMHNAHGFDIDESAVKVATHLYPDANIIQEDIRTYNPEQHFDIVIGNPPFNLDFGNGRLSQYYYCEKAANLLNPGGLLLLIVPCSFLQSDFWNKAQVRLIEDDFSFIGQTLLPANAFADTGVESFATKIVAFQRVSQHIASNAYKADEFTTIQELKERITKVKEIRNSVRIEILRETNGLLHDESTYFDYKSKKYLYELKAHPHLKKHYPKAIALVNKLKNQRRPDNLTEEECKKWEMQKLTPAKVLPILHRYIKNQYVVPRKEIALVKTNYGFKIKGYAPRLLDKVEHKWVSMYQLAIYNTGLPQIPGRLTKKHHQQYDTALKIMNKKHKKHLLQSQKIKEIGIDVVLKKHIDKLRFLNVEMQACQFTELQKQDMNRLYQKQYSLINWQQGSGKTAVLFHYGKYQLEQKHVQSVVVLAPAIATELTWQTFLTRNGVPFVKIAKPTELLNLPKGIFVLVSLSRLSNLKRELKRWMKQLSNKVCLLFDESDEITNPDSNRTIDTLAVFRRAKYKMLGTGTTTRNNVNELYPQIELLYNNSVNMMCLCSKIYTQDKSDKTIWGSSNPYFGKPFPAYQGASLFRKCFSPTKTTVFGIEKQNQDIYNKDQLNDLIEKTILTRKFKEFAGEKYEIFSHSISPNQAEREVYKTIMEKFIEICNLYFNTTGDQRKEAAMKLVRQIQLLIRACSTPHTMVGYLGDKYPRKVHFIAKMVAKIDSKVAIGCTSHESLEMYTHCLSQLFPSRAIFVISGKVQFKKRQSIIKAFEETTNGILVCTQQSLKSSANIPSCNEVILEALQWNIPKMEQFYFRFIRLDSKHNTNVHFVNYKNSIEQNLLALVLTKERLNEFIKTGEVKQESEMFEEFDISPSLIESLLKREQDSEGKFYISWGNQRVA